MVSEILSKLINFECRKLESDFDSSCNTTGKASGAFISSDLKHTANEEQTAECYQS